MITNKHITGLVALLMAAAVLVCLLAMAMPEKAVQVMGGAGVRMEYEAELFDTEDIISIDIRMEPDDWEEMLGHAIEETYYRCDVVINGSTFHDVGIRTKGNTSLSSIASDPDNDRYSFKLEFDRYVEGQTCWGLDKLILNNNYADATNMKEAVVYDMYRYLEADASLYNYAKITVNSSYWGVYLALEAVEDSFLLRVHGVENGNLYKPENMDGGGGAAGGGRPSDGGEPFGGAMPLDDGEPFGGTVPSEEGEPSMEADLLAPISSMEGEEKKRERGMFRDFSRNSGGADLNYIDDDLESYSTIWEGSVGESSQTDHGRVVTALKKISQGEELEKYMDVDGVLRYMAVHSFVVNEDSLSGNMAHNYYLYEHDGKLTILPWDYNLSFGGMASQGGREGSGDGATDMINDPIDSPFSGTQFFDALLENEAYRERYHAYYRQLVEGYVCGGGFEETYQRIRSQIDGLVETDPNAMYSYEEYEAGAEMLYDTVLLRAESVRGQLDGTIPSTEEGQRQDPDALLDASSIRLDVMGTFMGGGRLGFPEGADPMEERGTPGGPGGERPWEERDAADMETPPAMEDDIAMDASSDRKDEMEMEAPMNREDPEEWEEAPAWAGDALPGRPELAPDLQTDAARKENMVWYTISLVLLLSVLLAVKRYPRKGRMHGRPVWRMEP